MWPDVRVPVSAVVHWHTVKNHWQAGCILKVTLPGLLCFRLVRLPLVGAYIGAGAEGSAGEAMHGRL